LPVACWAELPKGSARGSAWKGSGGQHRATQRRAPRAADDEAALTGAIVEWARRCGRHGCRRVAALPRAEGWPVNHMA
jgi:hypothetical protein